LKCTVDHVLQEFYTLFLTRFRTYKIASPPQTKMTSKDDIKGLVSLKFLRPWDQVYKYNVGAGAGAGAGADSGTGAGAGTPAQVQVQEQIQVQVQVQVNQGTG
jgi:hypothetical protein